MTAGPYTRGIFVDDEGFDSQRKPMPGYTGNPFLYQPEPEQPQPHLASETMGYHDPELAFRRHTPFGKPYLGEAADAFKPISTGDINAATPAHEKAKAARSTKIPYPPHPFYSEKELEEARSKPGLGMQVLGPAVGVRHPYALADQADDRGFVDKIGDSASTFALTAAQLLNQITGGKSTATVPSAEKPPFFLDAAKNSWNAFDPPSAVVDAVNALRAVPVPGNPAGSLATSDMDAALLMGSTLPATLAGAAIAPRMIDQGSLGVFVSPLQLHRAERAGHVGKGSWGSTEALAEAASLAKRLPSIDSHERQPFVADVWRRTGWDVGDPRFGHPLTELDSANVVLNPAAIERGHELIGEPYRYQDGTTWQAERWGGSGPLGDVLMNIGDGTPVGDALPFLRNIPATWKAGTDRRTPASGAFAIDKQGKRSIQAEAGGLTDLQKVLRHEGLGHGPQIEQLAFDGKSILGRRLDPPSGLPTDTLKSNEIRQLIEAAKRPAVRQMLRHQLSAAADTARYLSSPQEVMARLTEDAKPVDKITPPSLRDSFGGTTDPSNAAYVTPARR